MTGSNLYWGSTALLALLYLVSAVTYVVAKDGIRETILGFGYPGYLRPVLIAVKILAVAVVLSRVSVPLSDLAYAGMFFHLLLSAGAHIGIRRTAGAMPAMVGLILLLTSFVTQNNARQPASPYARAAAWHQSTLIERR